MTKASKSLTSTLSFSPCEIQITDGFWKKKMETNRRVSLPVEFQHCEETGRIDALKLTWKADDPNRPHIFWDSDVAKLIEACSYPLRITNSRPSSFIIHTSYFYETYSSR